MGCLKLGLDFKFAYILNSFKNIDRNTNNLVAQSSERLPDNWAQGAAPGLKCLMLQWTEHSMVQCSLYPMKPLLLDFISTLQLLGTFGYSQFIVIRVSVSPFHSVPRFTCLWESHFILLLLIILCVILRRV